MEGVTLVHDVHVWTTVFGNEAFTAHRLPDSGLMCDLSLLVSRVPQFLPRCSVCVWESRTPSDRRLTDCAGVSGCGVAAHHVHGRMFDRSFCLLDPWGRHE